MKRLINQCSLFDKTPRLGEYVENHGRALMLDEVLEMVGKEVVSDQSTESQERFMLVKINDIFTDCCGERGFSYFYGKKNEYGVIRESSYERNSRFAPKIYEKE